MKKPNEIFKLLSGGEGLDHFSFSQLSKRYKPISMWIVDYFCRKQDQRRKDKKRYKLGFGSCANNVAQNLIGKYYFEGADRKEIKDRDYKKVFQLEYNKYLKEPYDDNDKKIREQIEQHIHETITNILAAVKNIFQDKELTCERYVSMILKDLIIGITGRVDFETDDDFAECKTKPPTAKFIKGDLKIYTQTLPKEPDEENIPQVAFYKKASNKTPFLFYANDKDFIIFDDTHEKLSNDYLDYNLDQMIKKAKTIQRLLLLSNGDPMRMAELVERPDTTHWTMNDASKEQLQIIKKLWG